VEKPVRRKPKRLRHPILARLRIVLRERSADVGIFQQCSVTLQLSENGMSDLREVAKLHLDIPHIDSLVRNTVAHTDKLPQAVHIDRALPMRIRLVALTGEGHKTLRRDIVQGNAIKVRPVDNACYLEKGRAKAGRIVLVVLRIEDAA